MSAPTLPAPIRLSDDGALAVRNAPTRYRGDGALAPWSVVYAPGNSRFDVPAALTDVAAGYGWTELVPLPALSEAWSRLAAIAALLDPCSPPDLAAGFDLCPCGDGSVWPCDLTRAAWLARGVDPQAEVRAACEAARRQWTHEGDE